MSAGIEYQSPVTVRKEEAKPGRDKMHWCYYGIALVLAVMALVQLNAFRYALAAQKRWTPAAGRVTSNEVVRHHSRNGTSYTTFISYSYGAGSSSYRAGPVEVNKFKFYFSGGGAQEDLDRRYPPGKSIDVYVNPGDPSESSLGLAGAPGPLVPVVFLALAFGALYLGREAGRL